MQELYGPTITDPSLKELGEFAKWYNEKLGNYPIIVGGWAVYCYTKGLGSKDIDVVFLGEATKHMTLFDYFRSKIWKDIYDIITLSQLEIDAKKVDKFLGESKLAEYKTEIIQIIEDN